MINKISRNFIAIFVAFACVVCLSVTVLASDARVFDDAKLFTQEQIDGLQLTIDELQGLHNIDIVVVTTNDAAGKSSEEFADDYYDYNGFGVGEGHDGALLLLDMDNRAIRISTTGIATNYLNDARIEGILDVSQPFMVSSEYAKAAMAFLDKLDSDFNAGLPANGDIQTEDAGASGKTIALYVVIAFIGGALICLGVLAKYRLKFSQYNYPLNELSHMDVTQSQDIFLRENTTSRKIPKDDSSSGGGSSTHTSSSGTSHGGGGRSF